jgi:hypothetical protein
MGFFGEFTRKICRKETSLAFFFAKGAKNAKVDEQLTVNGKLHNEEQEHRGGGVACRYTRKL